MIRRELGLPEWNGRCAFLVQEGDEHATGLALVPTAEVKLVLHGIWEHLRGKKGQTNTVNERIEMKHILMKIKDKKK